MIRAHGLEVEKQLPFKGRPRGEVFFGVELEVEGRDKDGDFTYDNGNGNEVRKSLIQLSDYIEDPLLKNFALTKHDGSLVSGFEIVSCPASLTIQKREWKRFFEDERVQKELTVSNRCGMHVHFSRGPLTKNCQERIYDFVNLTKNRKFITTIGGRGDRNNFCVYGSRRATINRNAGGTRHYDSINFTQKGTVECRIFASTMDFKRFLSNLQFVVGLVHWQRLTKNQLEIEEFQNFLQKEGEESQEIMDFIKEKELWI